ncbi:MAG: tRNA 2-thiouridine(34) synthase MnmA [Oscillospiraceae bacterium]
MIKTNQKKVLVALSGGVDSSVCVHLLQEQGYYVEAAVMEFSSAHIQAVKDAQLVADQLGIKLHIIKCHELFKENVIDYFASEYLNGRTPNPCIICNPNTKFALLAQLRKDLGFDYMATGHYASVEYDEQNDKYYLKKAGVADKDQSYMLYRLKQDELAVLMFPLNNLSKPQVREIAEQVKLPCANKPDSQEVCFIPDNDYASFITKGYGESKKGKFIDPNGKPCGEHQGILHYTVGQRKGLGIALGYPAFVKSIDPISGDVFLGRKGDEYSTEIVLENCIMSVHHAVTDNMKVGIKIRSMAKECNCTAHKLDDKCWQVVFDEPQRAAAPGQSAVFYLNDIVLGGGIIR